MYIFTRVHSSSYHVTGNVTESVYTSCDVHILQQFSDLKKSSKGVSLISGKSIEIKSLMTEILTIYVREVLYKVNNKWNIIIVYNSFKSSATSCSNIFRFENTCSKTRTTLMFWFRLYMHFYACFSPDNWIRYKYEICLHVFTFVIILGQFEGKLYIQKSQFITHYNIYPILLIIIVFFNVSVELKNTHYKEIQVK